MVCCTLDTIKTPDGPRWFKRHHHWARYRTKDGQHYIVDHRGALRLCDKDGMSKKDRRNWGYSRKVVPMPAGNRRF